MNRLRSMLLVLLCLGAAPQQKRSGAPTYLARAGNAYITTEEFISRFELLPGLYRHRPGSLAEDKLAFLYSLIAEKLLAQEASSRRLDRDSVYLRSCDEVRKMLARDELYRREVSAKVSVSPAELRRGIDRARRQVLISFLYFDNEDDARMVRKQISSPSDIAAIRIDSSIGCVRDTATVIWGDADPAIEEGAYALSPGRISPVVSAGSGYYILRLLESRPNLYYTGMQPEVLRERVEDRIRSRKEHRRALAFMDGVLKDKTGYTRARPFHLLAEILNGVAERSSTDSAVLFTQAMWEEVRSRAGRIAGDSLVVAGPVMMTVEQAVGLLSTREFSVVRGRIGSVRIRLNAILREWADEELMGAEALRRGYDRSPAVEGQLALWQQSFLAQLMKDYVRAHVSVSDSDIVAALRDSLGTASVSRVQIRELRTRSIGRMREALDDLLHGTPFGEVIARWTDDDRLRAAKGLSGFFPVTGRPPIGEIAWRMNVGEQYGPVAEGNGYCYFELVAKDSAEAAPTLGREESFRQQLLRMKQRKILNQFLAQIGRRDGFDVYGESLARTEVSPTQMMTYRLLGFGGRMFAVPFVDRQVDWIGETPPEGTIVP